MSRSIKRSRRADPELLSGELSTDDCLAHCTPGRIAASSDQFALRLNRAKLMRGCTCFTLYFSGGSVSPFIELQELSPSGTYHTPAKSSAS
jgi:hypothetical protein